MTEEMKENALKQIEALQPQDITNLWHGLKEGLQLLKNAHSIPENVQALYVLTDGKSIPFTCSPNFN
jgi:Mg-chelatase subunit ChlD